MLLKTLLLEIEQYKKRLLRRGAPAPFQMTAYQVLKDRGTLGKMGPALALAIVRYYECLEQINDNVEQARQIINALIIAGTVEQEHKGLKGYYRRIDKLKSAAIKYGKRVVELAKTPPSPALLRPRSVTAAVGDTEQTLGGPGH